LQKSTSGDQARQEAVEEMLLRLRWDDSDEKARKKLSKIVARIWDDLEGVDMSGCAPLSSALWLDDENNDEDGVEERTTSKEPIAMAPPTEPSQITKAEDSPAERITSEEPTGIVLPTEATQITKAEDPFVESSTLTELTATLPPTEAIQVTEVEDSLIEISPSMLVEASSSSSPSDILPKRVARDGNAYTREEFCHHYGDIRGVTMWDEANEKARNATDEPPVTDALCSGDQWETRAAVARGRMDAGLQQAFDGLAEDVRRSVEQFAANQRANSRMKLPLDLTAKERKSVHLWAEMNRVEHKSFGYRGRRRLHLSVGNVTAGEEDSVREDEISEDDDYDGEDDYELED